MKIIFVGMHNKPNKIPLCGSTKSGKLINRIIDKIKAAECLKTNLYDVDYYPKQEEKAELSLDWVFRANPEYDSDVVVLLGAETHTNFVHGCVNPKNVIEIAHPSSQRSHEQMDKYVKETVKKIKNKIK